MTRWATTIFLTMTMFGFIGCSMCCGPYDFDYPTYGGIHHRSNPTSGRLGSPFSDPNWSGAGPSADSNLKPHPDPQGERDFDEDEPLEGDNDLERADEDLDDDLEGLDDDLEEMDRRLEELDRRNEGIDEEIDPELDDDLELESIEPLEDVKLKRRSPSQAQSRKRRRGALPRRTNRLR